MSNIKDYKKLKSKNKITVNEVEDGLEITKKNYDPDSGEELDDNIFIINKRDIVRKKEMLENQIVSIDSRKAEIILELEDIQSFIDDFSLE